MKTIRVIHLGEGSERQTVSFLSQPVEIERFGSGGDVERTRQLIAEADGRADAIALEGMPLVLSLDGTQRLHASADMLRSASRLTPLVDGSGIRPGLERWGVILADRAEPGIFAEKNILMVPGLNHGDLAQALTRHGSSLRYADPIVYFALPDFPLGKGQRFLRTVAAPTLEQLRSAPYRRITPQPGTPGVQRSDAAFRWADVIAGDIGAIRRYAPPRLNGKTIVVEWATEEDLADLRERGAYIAITLMPSLDCDDGLGCKSAAIIEAALVALRPAGALAASEDTYLDMIAGLDWRPHIRYLQPDRAGVNRFAFVIHPLDVGFIHKHPLFRWSRYLPDSLVEAVAAYMPPMYVSKITGGQSPTTGQRIEGHLIALGATPRQMLKHSERFTYRRLNIAARMAERLGARIMGLGAFTKIVGDAGITVAHEADIAVTSGNSCTVAATLEAAKQAVIRMGFQDLTHGKVMVIGATGAIGSVCSRLLAQAIHDVVLVSIEPEKLIDLKRRIQEETPGAQVAIATSPGALVGECDLIVTATSAFGQRIMDISKCKPGAVICDVARPPDIGPAEAALRPDVLVIESGEVIIPGDIDFHYDLGLPPKVAYACLAEAALLAMEGRFEDYTLGRNITMEQVKEIYHLFRKHDFQIAGLTSFGKYVTDEEIAAKRELAEQLRRDAALFRRTQEEAAARLAETPIQSKGAGAGKNGSLAPWALAGSGLAIAWLVARLNRQR